MSPIKIGPEQEMQGLGIRPLGQVICIAVGAILHRDGWPEPRLIRPFASSIGHNHGLFDEA